LNAIAFWLNPPAGALLLGSFFFGGAQAGWTSYPPLSLITANTAQTMWILAIVLVGTSSILGSVNFLITIWKMRVPSLKWDQIPLFCWAMVATSILALFSTPVLAAGLILLLFDINFGTSFFPTRCGGQRDCVPAPVLVLFAPSRIPDDSAHLRHYVGGDSRPRPQADFWL
jgi:cytochrome c oxidase subunit 1